MAALLRSKGSTIQRYDTQFTSNSFVGEKLVKRGDGEKPLLGYEHTTGRGLKVSDDGLMAVPDLDQPKEFFADPSVIAAANHRLTNVQSHVELYQAGGSQEVRIPGKWFEYRSLLRVLPKVRGSVVTPGQEFAVNFVEECVDLANLIMGNHVGSKTGKYGSGTGLVKNTPMNYDSLVQSGLQLHSQAAQPKVGEAFATFSTGQLQGHWTYHFAGVVARSGEDAVTLENFNRTQELADASIEFVQGLRGVRDDLLGKILSKLSDVYPQSAFPSTVDLSKGGPGFLRSLVILPPADRAAVGRMILTAAGAVNREAAKASDQFMSDSAKRTSLWYFRMYGSPHAVVGLLDTPQDQSFHAGQSATGDFAAPETTSVRKA